MTSGPKVRFGTNWPSMTSHWMRSTPAFSSADHRPRRDRRSRRAAPTGRWGSGARSQRYAPAAPPYARPMLRLASDHGRRRRRASHATTTAGSCSSPAPSPASRSSSSSARSKRASPAPRVSVHEPAPGRVAPPCPHVADGCGGCDWQHVDPAAQVELKREIVADALRRIGRVADPASRSGPTLAPTGYRTTVRMGVSDGRAGFRTAAATSRRRRRCLVAHPLVAELIEHGRFGDARRGDLRAARRRGSGSCSYRPRPTRRRRRRRRRASSGRTRSSAAARAVPRGRAGRRFTISATSFFQARPDGAARAGRRRARGLRRRDELGTFVDAYCGVGLFAGLLGGDRKVVVVERNGPAVRMPATTSAACAGRPGRDRHCGTPCPPGWSSPIPAATRAGRQGRGAARRDRRHPVYPRQLRSRVARPGRRRAARAWVRDQGSTLIDLFPHTPHVEVVTRFDRLE